MSDLFALDPRQCFGRLEQSLDTLSDALEDAGVLETCPAVMKAFAVVAANTERLEAALNHYKAIFIGPMVNEAIRKEELNASPEAIKRSFLPPRVNGEGK